MNSQNNFYYNSFNNQNQNKNNYEYPNYYGSNNYYWQNNSDSNYYQFNDKFGKIIKYHNNHPVYSYIPPSFPSNNDNNIEIKESNIIKKKNSQNTKMKKPIKIDIPKEDMCYLRPPEYQPGFIQQASGKPSYVENIQK